MRSVKDAKLSLPLTEVLKIARLYICASRRASSVIAKAKAEVWQTTCSSLSLKFNLKSVYSLLCSIAGSSSSSPNFTDCYFPRESASIYAAYLRSHFSVFSQRPCVAEPEAIFSSSTSHVP